MKANTAFGEGRHVVTAAGIDIELLVAGAGPPLLFLHADIGPTMLSDRWLAQMAARYRVIAPFHPGFGRLERPGDLRDIGDLAYLYLELVDQWGIDRPVLVGASFGGWIAAEMVVRNPGAFAELVLIAPLGIKVGDRETRDIADVFAMTEAEFNALAFADPRCGELRLDRLDDEDLAAHFRGRESWAYFGWKPFMHNPRLLRWLCRAKLPALVVAGAQDRIVRAGYHEAFAKRMPQAAFRVIDDAGHYPHLERPDEVAAMIAAFREAGTPPTRSR